ncbi:MAG TPA: hypothetical protein VJS64_02170 [Pyrinomonadaceae bacterium]|nr:hypothetical protein [Pyrinomonadaceae bacterium]
MSLPSFSRRILVSLFLIVAATCATNVLAQGSDPAAQRDTKNDEINLDTQLYLLLATNQNIDDANLPTNLGPVVKQLRGSLPFRNYRLAATLINRVKNEGRLNLQWVGGPLLATAASSTQTPSFNEFKVNTVRLTADANGREMVRMDGFRFGARIPIQAGMMLAANSPAAPNIVYENTGLNTDISMHEGEPVIVGTINLGPSGDAIILVMTAKRSSK